MVNPYFTFYYQSFSASTAVTTADLILPSGTAATEMTYYNNEMVSATTYDYKKIYFSDYISYPNRETDTSPCRTMPQISEEKLDAEKCARKLLFKHLDIVNRWRYGAEKSIIIESGLFDDIQYEILRNRYERIKVWKDNKILTQFCLGVEGFGLPVDDVLFSKLLFLKYDEKNALKTAKHVNKNLLMRLKE